MRILSTIALICFHFTLLSQVDCETFLRDTESSIEISISKNDYEKAFALLDLLKITDIQKPCFSSEYLQYQEARIYNALDQQEKAFKLFFSAYQISKNKNYDLSFAALFHCLKILQYHNQHELIIGLVDENLSFANKKDKALLLEMSATAKEGISDIDFKNDLQELYKIIPDSDLERYYVLYSSLLSNTLLKEKNYLKASSEYYKLAGLSKEKGNVEEYLFWMNNYGYCLINSNRINDAISLYQSLLSENTNTPAIHELRYNYAAALTVRGDKSQSLLELSKLRTNTSLDHTLVAKAQLASAYIYFEIDEIEDALEAAQQAEINTLLTKNNELLLEVFTFYENYYTYLNDRTKARNYSQKLADLAEEKSLEKIGLVKKNSELAARFNEYMKDVSQEVSEIKETSLINEKKQLDNINKEQQLQLLFAKQEIADRELTISNAEKEKATQQLLLARLDLEKQQQTNRIALLMNEKTNQELSLARLEIDQKSQQSQLLELEKKTLLSEKTLIQQRENIEKSKLEKRIGWTIAVLSAIGALVALILLSRLRRKNNIIRFQHKELKEKTKDIQDSIQAAAAFQNGIAPASREIQSVFPDSMLLYLPLEDVSGDLPFVYTSPSGHHWLAAIDCIGHGIPAAMLSFSSYYSLKTAIQENDNLPPGDILSKLNGLILQSYMDKKDAEFNIGIDISLIKIKADKETIEFSGAKSPLMIIDQQGSSKIIKGDIYSVADFSTPSDFVFKNHLLPYQSLQILFIMSDGYAHQLGGPQRKVYSLSKLTQLITHNLRNNMHDLQKTLHKEHLEWKSNQPQTDDILLIGVQL